MTQKFYKSHKKTTDLQPSNTQYKVTLIKKVTTISHHRTQICRV